LAGRPAKRSAARLLTAAGRPVAAQDAQARSDGIGLNAGKPRPRRTALPADTSPSAPGDPGQRGNAGQVDDPRAGDAPERTDQDQGNLPGLPKLFFAPEDLDQNEADGSSGEAVQQNGSSGEAAGPGHPARPDQAAGANLLDRPGQPGVPVQPEVPSQPGVPGQSELPWHRPGPYGQPGVPGLGGTSQPGDTSQRDGFEPQGNFGRPPGPGFGQRGQRGRGGPLQRPPARPQRQRPTRQPDRELRHRALASLVLSVLALVALLGLGGDLHRGVYLLIFSAVVGIGSCVIGITAVVKARKTGSYRPRGSMVGIVLGAIAAVLSIPILATYLAFPHQVDNYVKCLSQTQSSGGEQSCMDKFYKSIHD
jgi:hypothetical protein